MQYIIACYHKIFFFLEYIRQIFCRRSLLETTRNIGRQALICIKFFFFNQRDLLHVIEVQWLARRYACILTWPIRIKRCFQSQSGAVQAKTHQLPVIFSRLDPSLFFIEKATIGSIDSWEEIALVFLV